MRFEITPAAAAGVLLALCGACAQVPTASPQDNLRSKAMVPSDGKSLIYVVRPAQGYDDNPMIVIVDRKNAGSLYGGTYQMAEVPGGHHKVACTFKLGESVEAIELDTKPGEVYFLKASRRIGLSAPRPRLELISQNEGRSFVQRFDLAPGSSR